LSNQYTRDIEGLWSEHQTAPFPHEINGDEFDGVCVNELDAAAAGLIVAFLATSSKLMKDDVAILESCQHDLEKIIPQLDGEAKAYFVRLEELTRMVLKGTRAGKSAK
jgi:hypothetical protein